MPQFMKAVALVALATTVACEGRLKEPDVQDPVTISVVDPILAKAEQGDAEAQFTVGKQIYRRIYTQEKFENAHDSDEELRTSYAEAFEWFSKAAEQGHAASQLLLGLMYGDGEGVPEDDVKAVEWFKRAAENGDLDAYLQLSFAYFLGAGVSQDSQEAMKWLRAAAEQGHAESQYELGSDYFSGLRVEEDTLEACKWWTRAAEQGHTQAQYELALLYLGDDEKLKDDVEAVKWLKKSAEQGHLDSKSMLCQMYADKRWVPLDCSEAVKFCKEASEEGNANAQYCYAQILYYDWDYGSCVDGDEQQAKRLYALAAEQGHEDAIWQLQMGGAGIGGLGLYSDYLEPDQLLQHITQEASTGNPYAQQELGRYYYLGELVPQDYSLAIEWYTRAANQGHCKSQYTLGQIYSEGSSVSQNLVQAYKWLNLAATPTRYSKNLTLPADAQKLRATLIRQMSPSQITEGQRESREFQPRIEYIYPFNGTVPSADSIVSPSNSDMEPTLGGTGFFISSDGYFVTAHHVIGESKKIQVVVGGETHAAEPIRADLMNDIALLRVNGDEFTALSVQPSRSVKVGQSVFTVGFPNISIQGTEAKYTEGSINSLSGIADDPRLFQTSVSIQPGNSGGPLLNEHGDVVGIVLSKLDDILTASVTGALPQNVNYALKSGYVLTFLEALPEVSAKLLSVGQGSEDVVERSKESIGMVLCF